MNTLGWEQTFRELFSLQILIFGTPEYRCLSYSSKKVFVYCVPYNISSENSTAKDASERLGKCLHAPLP